MLRLIIPLIVGMVIGFAEMKLSAKMQSRVGPYFAGGRWGWAQLIADGVKFFQKEDLIPDEADRPVFKMRPGPGAGRHGRHARARSRSGPG